MNSVKPCVVHCVVDVCVGAVCRRLMYSKCVWCDGARDVACCTLSSIDVRDFKLPLDHGSYRLSGSIHRGIKIS